MQEHEDPNVNPVPKIIIGLGFGDEGKGMCVAHETKKAIDNVYGTYVVRFNGGPQAAHNVRVVRRDGSVVHHTFSQFGSGTLYGAVTYITNRVLFDPMAFNNEASHLASVAGNDMRQYVLIDDGCPLVTPVHVFANRALERSRGDRRHGSTGNGVGIARLCEREFPGSLRLYDLLSNLGQVRSDMAMQKRWLESRFDIDIDMDDNEIWGWSARMSVDAHNIADHVTIAPNKSESQIADWISIGAQVIFEGSQGMLLDKRCGWFPHVTCGNMDAFEARRMCGDVRPTVIGVTRSYQTRHGAGPMPTDGTLAYGTFDAIEMDNVTDEWAGEFRKGLLDIPTLARAAESTCADEIAVSHMDNYPGMAVTEWDSCVGYDGVDRPVPFGMHVREMDEDVLLHEIERACNDMSRVTIIGRGDTTDKWSDR